VFLFNVLCRYDDETDQVMNYQRIPLKDLDKIEIGSSLGVVFCCHGYGSNIAQCTYDDYLSLNFQCLSVESSSLPASLVIGLN